MNILKMQSGGGMPPFTYYQPIAVNTQQPQQVVSAPSSRNAGTTKNNDLNDKDLMEMLGKIDGLPSDMDKVYNMLSTFYQDKDLGLSTASLSTTYLKALQLLKTAKFNKEQYENAYETVSKNKGLNEIAINQHGQIVTRDMSDGSMKFLTADQYLANKDKYVAMTNQELLQMRSAAPDYAYQNGVFNVVNNGIGLETIDKLVQQYMYELGENSVTNGGYLKNKDAKTLHSLEVVQSAVQQAKQAGYNFDSSGITLEGLYKPKLLTKDQAQQASNALNYIYQMLPDNAKTLLKVKAGGAKQAIDLLTSFISGQTNSDYDFQPELIEDKDGNKPGNKSSEGTTESHNNDLFQNIVRGEGGTNTVVNIMDKDGRTYQVVGTAFPSLSVNPSHQVPSRGRVSDLMANYGLSGIYAGNQYAITFGNHIMSDIDMDNTVFVNNGQSVRSILPIKNVGGKIVPDLEFMAKHEDLIKFINSKGGNMNDPEVKKKLIEAGIINQFTGLPDLDKFHPYLCVNGLSTDRHIEDTTMSHKVSSSKLDDYIDIFESALYRDKNDGDQGKAFKFNFDRQNVLNPLDWFDNYDHLLEGTIFIPITQNVLQASTAAGTTMKQNVADSIEETYQIGELSKTARPTSSNLLGI